MDGYYFWAFFGISVEEWGRIFAVNARGSLLCMREAISRQKNAGRSGSITNISSVISRTALIFGNSHFSATKVAINGMATTAAFEFAEDGIRINAILPEPVITEGTKQLRSDPVRRGPILNPDRIPLKHRGEPSDIAAAALYLVSPAASYVTGQLFAVDGGFEIS